MRGNRLEERNINAIALSTILRSRLRRGDPMWSPASPPPATPIYAI